MTLNDEKWRTRLENGATVIAAIALCWVWIPLLIAALLITGVGWAVEKVCGP